MSCTFIRCTIIIIDQFNNKFIVYLKKSLSAFYKRASIMGPALLNELKNGHNKYKKKMPFYISSGQCGIYLAQNKLPGATHYKL